LDSVFLISKSDDFEVTFAEFFQVFNIFSLKTFSPDG